MSEAAARKPRPIGLDWGLVTDEPEAPVVETPAAETPVVGLPVAPSEVTPAPGVPVAALPTRPLPARPVDGPSPAGESAPEEAGTADPVSFLPVRPYKRPRPTKVEAPTAPTAPAAEQVAPVAVEQAPAPSGLPTRPAATPASDVPAGVDPVTGEITDGVAVVGEEWEDLAEETSRSGGRKAKEMKVGPTGGKANKGFALTQRDVDMLQFLTRYKYATYPQMALMFNTTPVALRQRMPRMKKEGLVQRRPIGKSSHGVWIPTKSGVRVSGLDLPLPQLAWATVAHSLGLVDIGIRLELAGETVLTEREIRAADTRDRVSESMQSAMKYLNVSDVDRGEEPLYAIRMGAGEGTFNHIPDLVVARPAALDGTPQSVAIELELNHKPATEWRKILRGYLKAPNIGAVYYYTDKKSVASGVQKAAKEVGAEGFVTVRKFTPSESTTLK